MTADLLKLPLIASDIVDPSWQTWRSWAFGVGLGSDIGKASDRSRLRSNHYTDTIPAAVNGDGVALGWAALIQDHLKDGRLTRLGTARMKLIERYHVLVPNGRDPSPATQSFLDWIAETFVSADRPAAGLLAGSDS